MLFVRQRLAAGGVGSILHFAPFPKKADVLSRWPGIRYLSADMQWPEEGLFGTAAASEVMLRSGMEAIPRADGEFDLVLAISVMQFVIGDERAFAEVARVLRAGGMFVLETTLFGEKTEECYSPEELASLRYAVKEKWDGLLIKEKWVKDGQMLHDPRQFVRKYGTDIVGRLERAGFAGEVLPCRQGCANVGVDVREVGIEETTEHVLLVCTKNAATRAA